MNKKWLLLVILGLALVLFIPLIGCTPTSTSTPTPSLKSTPTPVPRIQPTSAGWTTFTTDDGLSSNITTSIIQDKQGIIWVSSTQGLTRYDGNHWEIYTASLGDTHISCSARDKQDSLWFGTSREGAYEYTEDVMNGRLLPQPIVSKAGLAWRRE